jgi:hypothetical protein
VVRRRDHQYPPVHTPVCPRREQAVRTRGRATRQLGGGGRRSPS